MVHYKLIYFNARGAAELSRLLFKVKGVEFEDVRISVEDWPELKPKMPLEALPVLEIDGDRVTQSAAIARYLAKEFGLMGSNSLEDLKIDEFHEVSSEIINIEVRKIFVEQDANKKVELAKEFVNGPMEKFMNFFEDVLKKNKSGNGFYIGDKLTLADLIVYDTLNTVDGYIKSLKVETKLSSHEFLTALIKRVENVPNVAKWLQERPVTDM